MNTLGKRIYSSSFGQNSQKNTKFCQKSFFWAIFALFSPKSIYIKWSHLKWWQSFPANFSGSSEKMKTLCVCIYCSSFPQNSHKNRKFCQKSIFRAIFDPFSPIYIHKVKSPKFLQELPRKFFGELAKNEHLRPTHLFFKIPAKIAKK